MGWFPSNFCSAPYYAEPGGQAGEAYSPPAQAASAPESEKRDAPSGTSMYEEYMRKRQQKDSAV